MRFNSTKFYSVLCSVVILINIISCQKPNQSELNIDSNSIDFNSDLTTSNSNDSELDSWLIPLLSEYLTDDVTVTIPPPITTTTQKGAINERFSLPIVNPNNENVLISTNTYGYSPSIINYTTNEVIFDLNRYGSLVPQTHTVEILAKTGSGKTIGIGEFELSSIFKNAEVVVNLENLSQAQFEIALRGTEFSIEGYSANQESAIVQIGRQSTEEALSEINKLIEATQPNSLSSQVNTELTVVSGPDFAYKTDGWSVRSLDPTCSTLPILSNYKDEDNWSRIADLATLTNATQAHAQGLDGSGIVIYLLDSGTGLDDDFDCANTPYKEQHGTHIYNILKTLAPNAEIISRKVFDTTGAASNDNLFNSFGIINVLGEIEREHLSKNKKVIVNMSFSSPQHPELGVDTLLWGSLNELYKKDNYRNNLLVVASAGNHGLDDKFSSEIFFPSGFSRSWKTRFGAGITTVNPFDNVLSVGSAGLKGNQTQIAQYNPTHSGIDLLAYGINLCADAVCSGGELVGSSFSVPVVSAIAALNWQQCNNLTSHGLITQLKTTGQLINGTNLKLATSDHSYNCGTTREIRVLGQFGLSDSHQYPSHIVSDSDGNAYILGSSSNKNTFVTKLDSEGNEIWLQQYGANVDNNEFIESRSLTIDSKSNIYVTTATFDLTNRNGGFATEANSYTVKYNDNGIKQFTHEFQSSFVDDTITDLEDNLIVVNRHKNDGSKHVSKYSSSGHLLWNTPLVQPEESYIFPNSMTTDSQGNIYIVGELTSLAVGEFVLLKYDPNGNYIWSRYFASNNQDISLGFYVFKTNVFLSIDQNDNLYISGKTPGTMVSNNSYGGFDIFVSKFDKDGNQIWVNQYGSIYYEATTSLVTTKGGTSFIGGFVTDFENINTSDEPISHFFIKAIDENGDQLWRQSYDLTSWGYYLTNGLEHTLYVTGGIYNSSNNNWDGFFAKVNQ